MEAPLPIYDQVRNEVHRETPDVGQHDLSIYYKDTIIMRILMRVHDLMTPYSPIFITQEKHYAYTLGAGVAFTPLERVWILKGLEDQHPSWTSDEVEEALEKTECSEIGNLPMFRAYEEEVSGSVEYSNDHEKVRRSGENSRSDL